MVVPFQPPDDAVDARSSDLAKLSALPLSVMAGEDGLVSCEVSCSLEPSRTARARAVIVSSEITPEPSLGRMCISIVTVEGEPQIRTLGNTSAKKRMVLPTDDCQVKVLFSSLLIELHIQNRAAERTEGREGEISLAACSSSTVHL